MPDDLDDDELPVPKKQKNVLQKGKSVADRTPATSRFAFSPKSGNSTPRAAARTPSKLATTPARETPRNKKDRDEVRYSWLVDVKDADQNKRMLDSVQNR